MLVESYFFFFFLLVLPPLIPTYKCAPRFRHHCMADYLYDNLAGTKDRYAIYSQYENRFNSRQIYKLNKEELKSICLVSRGDALMHVSYVGYNNSFP